MIKIRRLHFNQRIKVRKSEAKICLSQAQNPLELNKLDPSILRSKDMQPRGSLVQF